MQMVKVASAIVLIGVAGCTSRAGPFVTNVSSDGRGNLVIEKCMVELQRQISTVQNTDCTATAIALGMERRGANERTTLVVP